MVDRRKPSRPEMTALIFDRPASKITRLRPSNIRLAYSGGPKTIASSATSGAVNVRRIKPTVPAMNEPIAAMPRAGPALPCRAIWYPSIAVTTDASSPGMFSRIDVVDPPYFAP
jgi:hypothetical protein